MTTDGSAYHLGVDLGTTYVAAGILEQGRPEIITLGDRNPVLPSVLYFKEDGEVLTGESATRRGLNDPTRVVREFKRRVGDTTPVIVGQTPYSVDALMAKLVRVVHDAVVERQGGAPQSMAVTHPANWGPYKIDVLEQAVRLAGIGEVTTITEPVAAAIHYAAAERMQPGETVAVYDLGGGTFDAAVLRKTDDDFTVLGEVEGIERLGGIDFDEAVFQHVVRFCESSLSELDIDDSASIQALARLRQECVEAKEVLSTDTEVTIPVVLPNLQTEVRLTRAEFEAMIRPLLRQTVEALRRAIASAEVDPQQLSAVLLVGGCSRIPLIAEMVGAELGRPIAVDRHPKHTVALGAAIAAGRSAEAPEPKVDDWFRTEPTTTTDPEANRASTGEPPLAAAGLAVGAAVGSNDSDDGDPFARFPMKDGAATASAQSGTETSTRPDDPAPQQAESANAMAGRNPEPLHSPAEQLGTAPVRLPRSAAAGAAAVPLAASATAASAAGSTAAPAQAPATPAPAPAGPAPTPSPVANQAPPSPLAADSGPAGHAPMSFSSTSPAPSGSTLSSNERPPTFPAQQSALLSEHPRAGGRLLIVAAVAAIAFVVLGGTAWAFTREPSDATDVAAGLNDEDLGSPSTIAEGDPSAPGADSGNDDGETGRNDNDDGGQTGTTVGNGGTTGNQTTTTTDRGNATTVTTDATTTTTEKTTTTTVLEAKPIRIISGPRVNSRSDNTFHFNYTTNDVCGTGSFRVTEKSTGRAVGSFQGISGACAGPLHGGFPNGASAFSGFDLKPGTTYRVAVTVRGTPSDGHRPAGEGTDSASFEVTTTGTVETTTTTTLVEEDTTTTTEAEVTTTTETTTETETIEEADPPSAGEE